jgi:hypothetical protein
MKIDILDIFAIIVFGVLLVAVVVIVVSLESLPGLASRAASCQAWLPRGQPSASGHPRVPAEILAGPIAVSRPVCPLVPLRDHMFLILDHGPTSHRFSRDYILTLG